MQLLGFKKTYSDPSLYIYDRDGIKVIVPVFVDDITLASKCIEALDKFVGELGTHFKLRDLGPTSYLLGIRIERETAQRRIYLSQTQYIVNKLEEFGMTDCKPVGTPMLPGLKLSSSQSPQTVEEKAVMENIPYMNAVGSLLYLATITRPDIAYAASVLARFNANPGMAHWKAVKHVFRYLKGTIGLKLMYGPNPEQDDLFVTFSDADLGGNPDNGRSTTGYMTRIGLGVVDWMSKLQPVVTLSTTESELVAGVTAGRGMAWIRNLVDEIGYAAPTPSKLFTDNMSAMQVSKNPEHHGRMKHLDLCWYWLREQVGKKKIAPLHLPTEEMPADLLTKALPKPKSRILQLLQKGSNNPYGSTHKTGSLDFYHSPTQLVVPSSSCTQPSIRRASAPPTSSSPLTTPPSATSAPLPQVLASPTSSLADHPTPLHNVCASGWAATGTKGVLAATIINAYAVADTILSDWLEPTKHTPSHYRPGGFGMLDAEGRTTTCFTEASLMVMTRPLYVRLRELHGDDWDDLLPEAEFQYNNHIYSTTKYTPFMLDTGRNPCMGFEPWPLNSTNETANEFFERMKLVQEEAKAALAKAKDDMARYYDQCCIPAPEYKPGDCVYLDASNIETMRPSNCYLGPYTVERQVGRIQAPSTTLYEPPPPHVQRHQAPPCSPSSRLLPLQTPDSDIRTRT
ncbi:putative reverse transcriptase (RNA-dependent DNA polymerase) [Lyophyllum shimeji]|uniref:Reverse transcriptase (RNA-dependent DNA polymerase) n=1 Tax=Lyophyllum shimeji TaxID=47721 RepID=A0A9P3UQK1_LYOSH|nr:putative reverse transcriptase (RNA-dependent DNA polymerase) [Lyophyllum shimeji]